MQKLIRPGVPVLRFCVVAVGVVCCFSLSRAEDNGWKMPNLNPFVGSSNPPTSTRRAQPPTSTWKMPKLWTQTKAPAKPQAKVQAKARPQPSTWNRVTSGTQNALSKTADALNPWDNKQPAPPPKLTGTNSLFTNKSTVTPAKKDTEVKAASWWSSDKKEKDKTVNEFLSHPRLQ